MARWRWLSSIGWSKGRSSSKSKASPIARSKPKARTSRPDRRSRRSFPTLRVPEAIRNRITGAVSTAKLVPFFAATDTYCGIRCAPSRGWSTNSIKNCPAALRGFTNRTRSARRRMQALERMSATQRHTQQVPKYRELLRITGQVLESAHQVVKKTAKIRGVDVVGHLAIDQLRQQITTYCDLGEKVIHQTRRRVLDGEQVPPDEKVYSIFESHTHLIKRGKQRQPVEFGHKVFLAESSQGLITDYQILDGNPADTTQVQASLDHHHQVFQHSPELYAGDRGFYSADNVDHCQEAGVSQVYIPQRGGQKTANWVA